ncbi:hypothetical protein CYLTODRAFT_420042, partial [Cylindrobasidium torrendii FP15055 ss-10]
MLPLSFESLPNELWELAFAYLDARDIARCRETCKHICSFIDASLILRYIQCLGRNGMVAEGMREGPVKPQMDALMSTIQGWARPDYERIRKVELPSAGFTDRSWQLNCNMMGFFNEDLSKIHLLDVSSPAYGGETERLELILNSADVGYEGFGSNASDEFAMFPSLDLIITVRRKPLLDEDKKSLHQIRMTSLNGKDRCKYPHDNFEYVTEAAANERIHYGIDFEPPYFGLLISSHEMHPKGKVLLIWDCITGEMEFVCFQQPFSIPLTLCVCQEWFTPALYTFAFLDDRHILVGSRCPIVMPFRKVAPQEFMLRLRLPREPIGECMCLIDGLTRRTELSLREPFMEDPDQAIFLIEVGSREGYFIIIVRARAFKRQVQRYYDSEFDSDDVRVLWDDWAVTDTHVLPPQVFYNSSLDWGFATFGSQLALLDPNKRSVYRSDSEGETAIGGYVHRVGSE